MRTIFTAFMCLFFTFTSSIIAEEKVDLEVVNKIRYEGLKNSQVMDIAFYLTDVHGPRLTGSPNLRSAAEWARDTMTEWGLANSHLEEWGYFGRGWTTEGYSLEMTSPQYMNLIAHPKAWTPGTDTTVQGTPVHVVIEKEEDLEQYRGKLAGKIVLLGKEFEIEQGFEAEATRRTDEELSELMMAQDPGRSSARSRRQSFIQRRAMFRKRSQLMTEEKAALTIEPSRIKHGTLRVTRGGSPKASATPAVPALVVAPEQYNRMVRLLDKNMDVQIKGNVQNSFHLADSIGFNVIAEIPGKGKLKNEIVMLGAHLDSWHAGTGATDNAAGSAVMMEAIRILKAIDVQPKRTIRLALWTGEEQGLLGSKGYAKKHFGDAETMKLKSDHKNLSAYYNLDNGTGKIRGIYLQEHDAMRPIFEAYFKPFHDLGASTLTIRNTSGTDHLTFNALGLPGFQFIQDPVSYFTRTWHTNMDTYDHLQANDLMSSAVIVASIVYHTAMRDDRMPRKPLKNK
ncbi:MAG: M28 family metallopeptidase [Calditrichia bacterium]